MTDPIDLAAVRAEAAEKHGLDPADAELFLSNISDPKQIDYVAQRLAERLSPASDTEEKPAFIPRAAVVPNEGKNVTRTRDARADAMKDAVRTLFPYSDIHP